MVEGRSGATGKIRPVVLVVDDDDGLCDSFRLILGDDYDFLEAPDVHRALETSRTSHVDMVLLDVRLPDTEGIQLLDQNRAFDDSIGENLDNNPQGARAGRLEPNPCGPPARHASELPAGPHPRDRVRSGHPVEG